MNERRRIFYSGRVQGVGFRYTTQATAKDFRVFGWVRNLPEGRVELLAEGEPQEVTAFLARIDEIMGRNIHAREEFHEAATGEFSSFTVAY